MKRKIWRAFVGMAFVIFLFYSNLLMGEYERSGAAQKSGLLWAIRDVFTLDNLEIAVLAALAGYILFEYLRKPTLMGL
ncbi:MAG TPA: hypothetical protein VJP02_24505 [Candidatus Sulfotelmatobacter sp.]|nr:hypothetical protein [Candidatus Sulfotelmatobacter sp.]